MCKRKYDIIVIFAVFVMIFSQIPLLIMMSGISTKKIETSDTKDSLENDILSDLNPIQKSYTDTESERISFTKANSYNFNVPFNIDVAGQYVHTLTDIDIDWKLVLPIDINVIYENRTYEGDAHDMAIELILPENQAYFDINISLDYTMAWDILGVKKDSFSLINKQFNIHKAFTTPLGKYNLDFLSYTYKIPVVIEGVYIGDVYIKVTPQIISSIVAELLSNPNFCENIAMEWNKAEQKSITLTTKNQTSEGATIVKIGNFEYVISLGFEWAVGFDFVGPFEVIDIILDMMGYDLEWVLGTWPIIKIGSIPTTDTIDLSITIFDGHEPGDYYGTARSFDPFDWWDKPKTIIFPNIGDTNDWYYKFPVHKDWDYIFEVTSSAPSKTIQVRINKDQGTSPPVASSTFSGTELELSFSADSDGVYYLYLSPLTTDPFYAQVKFENIEWPGISQDNLKLLNHPDDGDLGFLTKDNSSAWYTFHGDNGDLVSFWCFELNNDDNLDMRLYFGTNLRASSTSTTDNPEMLTLELADTGWYDLRISGDMVSNNFSYFWIDYGLSTSGMGESIDNPETLTNFYQGGALGPELSTTGGNWLKASCAEETIYTFKFDGQFGGTYDFVLIDTDKTTVLDQGTFIGNPIEIKYTCLLNHGGDKYIHILPYAGGFTYNITKSSTALYYSGEDQAHAHIVETNFPLQASFPTNWSSSEFWEKIYVNDGEMLLLKLENAADDNYDLYLYLNTLDILDTEQNKGDTEVITYETSHSSWYTIRVDQVSGAGQYTLTTAIAKECEQGDYKGTFTPETLNQYYYVELKEGETIDIDFDCEGFRSSYVNLYLYDSDLNELEKDGGPALSVSYTAKESGTYFIRIHNSEIGTGTIAGDISVTEEEPVPEPFSPLLLILIVVGAFAVISIFAFVGIHKARSGEWPWQSKKFKSKMTNVKRKLSSSRENLSGKLSVKMSHVKSKKTAPKKSKLDVDRIIELKGEKSKSIEEEIEFDADDMNTEDLSSFMKKLKVSENMDNAEFWKDLIEDKGLNEDDVKSLKDLKVSDHLKESEFWKKFVKDKKEE